MGVICAGFVHMWHTDWKFKQGKEKYAPVAGEGRRTQLRPDPRFIPHKRLTKVPIKPNIDF